MTRVCVATAGHLSTCPRMVKVADLLAGAGYDVHVVSTQSTDWASAADREVFHGRGWSWEAIDLRAASDPWRYRWTGGRHRLARTLAARVDAEALPWRVAVSAFARASAEIAAAVSMSRADIYFAGTSGALAAVHDAARRRGVLFGVDLEDFHLAEREDDGARLHHALARRVLTTVLPAAALVTTASREMAQAYQRSFGVEPLVIHNVWARSEAPPSPVPATGPLRFYWFSQTIGPGRGLDEAVRALGAAGIDAELTVRGRADQAFVPHLVGQVLERAPRVRLSVEPPVAPDAIPATCHQHHVGLCTELTAVENHGLALSNKLFMYLTTGLALLATPTPAQRSLLAELQGHVAWLDPETPEQVGPLLRRWDADRSRLDAARRASWEAAARRWHWEHPNESGRLLAAFARLTRD